MPTRLRWTQAAKRGLRSIKTANDRHEVAEAILDLLHHRELGDFYNILLQKSRTVHRIRIRGYRIIYRITPHYILIVRIEQRSGRTYRGFENPNV